MKSSRPRGRPRASQTSLIYSARRCLRAIRTRKASSSTGSRPLVSPRLRAPPTSSPLQQQHTFFASEFPSLVDRITPPDIFIQLDHFDGTPMAHSARDQWLQDRWGRDLYSLRLPQIDVRPNSAFNSTFGAAQPPSPPSRIFAGSLASTWNFHYGPFRMGVIHLYRQIQPTRYRTTRQLTILFLPYQAHQTPAPDQFSWYWS